jgi:hypothetical protein
VLRGFEEKAIRRFVDEGSPVPLLWGFALLEPFRQYYSILLEVSESLVFRVREAGVCVVMGDWGLED